MEDSRSDMPDSSSPSGEEGAPSSPYKKVMVIDDEVMIITYITTVLEDHGYETCSVADAEEALDVALREHPDLICLDIMMPKHSGITLFQAFRLAPETREIPIVFVSAFSQLHDLREPRLFRKLVPDERIPMPEACIEKPIDVPLFISTVESFIGSGAFESETGGAESS